MHLLRVRSRRDLAFDVFPCKLVFCKRQESLALFIPVANKDGERGDVSSNIPAPGSCVPFQGVPGRRRVQRPHAAPLSPSPSLSSFYLSSVSCRTISFTFADRVSPLAERTLLSCSLPLFPSTDYHFSSTFRGYSPPPPPHFSFSPLITLGGLNAFITRPFSLQTFGKGWGARGGEAKENRRRGGNSTVEIRERGKR